MGDRVDLGEPPATPHRVADIATLEGAEPGVVGILVQRTLVAGDEIVDSEDLVTGVEQRAHRPAADEAGGASYEHPHAGISARRSDSKASATSCRTPSRSSASTRSER